MRLLEKKNYLSKIYTILSKKFFTIESQKTKIVNIKLKIKIFFQDGKLKAD